MTEPDTSRPSRKILVAVDTSLANLHTLNAAASLANKLRARLETLFVEDINLFHWAELPFTNQLDKRSGEISAVNADRLSTDLHAHALKVEQALNAATQTYRLDTRMTVVRGHYLDEALRAGRADVLFMHSNESIMFSRDPRSNEAGIEQDRLNPVCVFFDDSAQARRALIMAANLSHDTGTRLIVLVPSNTDTGESIQREQIDAVLAQQFDANRPGQPGKNIKLLHSDLARLSKDIASADCAMAVLPRDICVPSESQPALSLSQIKCQVALVS